MSTLYPKVVFKTELNLLTVQVTGHVWADDTQGRCMMRSLAVSNFDIMDTMGYTPKSMSTFLWSSHTC